MSFSDDPGVGPRRSGPEHGFDHQTVVTRRIIAGVIALVLALILIFGIRACLGARKAQAFEDYVADIGALVGESDQQGDALFALFEDPGTQSSVDVENTINGFRVESEQLIERARQIDVPDELSEAQGYLLQSLSFRSDGLSGLSENLPTALGDTEPEDAEERIAGQMQNFLTSDVIYSQRVLPAIQTGARDADLLERVADLPESQFLPDVSWLQLPTVENAIGSIKGEAPTSGGNDPNEKVAPGLHGTGLQGVTVQPSGDKLSDGGVTTVDGTEGLSFEVEVQNQGENDEQNVAIRLTIDGGDAPIDISGEIPSIKVDETVALELPLTEGPPTNEDLTVDVTVEGVPGEENEDNNSAEYLVRFGG